MTRLRDRLTRCALTLGLTLICALSSAQQSGSQYFQTTPMPEPREKAGAAVIGDHLYVIGGQTAGKVAAAATLMADIDAEGNVANWRETSPLPGPLLYTGNSTVARGPIIYVCGGNINDGVQNTAADFVVMAAQREDGNLSRWITSERFPGPGLQAATAVASNSHLYVIGGADTANNPQPVVYHAAFRRDGLLESWGRGPDMPRGLWFHMAGIANNRIYVWGGTNPAGVNGSVDTTIVADILPDGSLSPWRTLPPLPNRLYFSASASLDNTLFNFSGRLPTGNFVSDVLFAIPDSAGDIAWELVRAAVPLNKYLAPAVDQRRGIIYLPGGNSNDLPISEVYGYRVPRFEVAEAFTTEDGSTQTEPTDPATEPGTTPTVEPAEVQAATLDWGNFAQAELQAVRGRQNMMLYFQTPRARQCREVEEAVFTDPGFAGVAERYALANVNAAENRALAVTYGVYRVPSVVIVRPDGQHIQTLVRDDITIGALQRLP